MKTPLKKTFLSYLAILGAATASTGSLSAIQPANPWEPVHQVRIDVHATGAPIQSTMYGVFLRILTLGQMVEYMLN